MDSAVSNERKFRAFDGVLAALHNIFPRSNTAYCQALEKQLAYVNKKNPSDLERMAKDAYFHSHGVDIMQYGKVIYGAYKLSKDKENVLVIFLVSVKSYTLLIPKSLVKILGKLVLDLGSTVSKSSST